MDTRTEQELLVAIDSKLTYILGVVAALLGAFLFR
jgi:hypothetical protein